MSRIHDQLSQSITTPPQKPIVPRVATPAPPAQQQSLPFDTPPAAAAAPAAPPAPAPTPAVEPAAPAPKSAPPAAAPEPRKATSPLPRHPGTHRPVAPRPIYTPSTDLKSPPLGGKKAIAAFGVIALVLMAATAYHILTEHNEPVATKRVATVRPAPEPAPPQVAIAEPTPAAPAPAEALPEPAVTETPPEKQPDRAATEWPTLALDGAHVVREEEGLSIIFDYGLFARVDQLRPEASDALNAFAKSVLPHLNRLSIVVTGFTDNEPVPANRPYKSNYDLGMMRAMAVTRALIEAGIPPGSISTRSLGDQQTPYPNDTPQNKTRNRTATISLRSGT